jgi:hypothetical protein
VGIQPCCILWRWNSCKSTYNTWGWRSMMLRSWRLWKPSRRKKNKIMSYTNYTNLTNKFRLLKKEQNGDGHPCIHSWSNILHKLVLNAHGSTPHKSCRTSLQN